MKAINTNFSIDLLSFGVFAYGHLGLSGLGCSLFDRQYLFEVWICLCFCCFLFSVLWYYSPWHHSCQNVTFTPISTYKCTKPETCILNHKSHGFRRFWKRCFCLHCFHWWCWHTCQAHAGAQTWLRDCFCHWNNFPSYFVPESAY